MELHFRLALSLSPVYTSPSMLSAPSLRTAEKETKECSATRVSERERERERERENWEDWEGEWEETKRAGTHS